MREALHTGVKKALAVVSSHYAGIDLPAVCEGYVLPDDETDAQEEVQRLDDAATVPRDALAAFFDDEAELPPSGLKDLGRQGSRILSLLFFLWVLRPVGLVICIYNVNVDICMNALFELFP